MGIIGERFRKCPDCSVATVPELMQKPLKGNFVSYIVIPDVIHGLHLIHLIGDVTRPIVTPLEC